MSSKEIEQQEAFGPNIWLVDEMYRNYQESPQSVSESWREFFEDYHPQRGGQSSGGGREVKTEAKAPPPDAARAESKPRPGPEKKTEPTTEGGDERPRHRFVPSPPSSSRRTAAQSIAISLRPNEARSASRTSSAGRS